MMVAGTSLSIRGLSKSFDRRARALDDVSLEVAPGEMVALIGASGSGKSTLLRHVAGFLRGDGGEIRVESKLIQSAGRFACDLRVRRAEIGFVFQQFNLVGRLSVMTNVLMGCLPRVPAWRSLTGRFTRDEKAQAWRALQCVGIDGQAWRRASTLSGGQQQRVAIARALVQGARLILADEPIASLDPESARNVMETLARINREQGITVLVSLHQVDFARRYCARTVALRAGEIVFDGASADLDPAALRRLYGAAADALAERDPVRRDSAREPVLAAA